MERIGNAAGDDTPSGPGSRRLNRALLAVTLAALAWFAWGRPYYNWDLVAYVRLALADGSADPVELHRRTWAVIAAEVPGSSLALLKGEEGPGAAYRRVQLSDPHAFASQLPMYEVKVGYVLLLRLLAGLTGTIGAVQLLDFLGTALATVTLFLACRCLPGTLGLVWVPLALLLPVVPLARLATPDALCVGLYGAGFLLLTRERIAAGLALALLGLSMRPDNVVLNAVLSGALLLLGRTRAAAAFGLASAGLYALAIRLSGYIGWWKHFSVSMVAAQPDLRGFEPAFSPYQYAKAIYRVFDWFLLVEPWGTLVVLAALLAFHLTRGREEEMRLERALLSALLLAFGVRLLIFPIPEFRPYAPILIGVYLCLLSTGRKSLSRTAGGSRP